MTSGHGHVRLDLCRALEPQLQIIAEASVEELSPEAKSIDSERKISLRFQPLRVAGKPAAIDTAYLTHLPSYFVRPRTPEFNQLRIIRAHIAWLHADLEILTHMLRRCILDEVDPAAVSNYLIELARGLRNAPGLDGEERQIVFELMRIVEEFHDNRISRLLAGLGVSKLSSGVKNQVSALLERRVSRDALGLSAERRPLAKEDRAESLNERMRQALDTYAKYLTAVGETRSARYSDEKFRSSAQRKAEGVLQRLPESLDRRRVVFVSVGGADGTEMFHLLELTGSRYGVLLEYSDQSAQTACEEAKRRNLDVAVFTGDVMQKINYAMRQAVELRERGQVLAVVVTAHAVLHELETRSMKFSLRRYFSKLSKADIVMGREPIEPPNWEDRVLLYGNFEAELFIRLAKVIRGHHDRFRGLEFTPEIVNPTTVELHRALAIETLTKAFYSEDFLYELEECVSSISADKLMAELNLCLSSSHSCQEERLTSPSINRFWEEYGLQAKSSREQRGMTKPLSHMWYVAVKRSLLWGKGE